MTNSAKVVYAQSSDIKSRTHLEYRRDMKKKAIAELEFLPFLHHILLNSRKTPLLKVVKSGGDAELWFGNDNNISQQPDYRAEWEDKQSFLYEFQYATETENLSHFDFKVSKVGKKTKGVRIPHKDREFFYVAKPTAQYAFISPEWIMQNGREAPVPAWGSRPAYRVPRDIFISQLKNGGEEIQKVIDIINDKNILLDFQHEFLSLEDNKLSRRLQQVVDDKKILTIMPNNLDGFYEVCYLLEKLGKSPDNPGVWLVYLASFFHADMTAMELARFMFSIDFLYFKCGDIRKNEQNIMATTIADVARFIGKYPFKEGLFCKNKQEAPIEETRQILFSINLLEDLTQDIVVNLNVNTPKITNIFATVPDIKKITTHIKEYNLNE